MDQETRSTAKQESIAPDLTPELMELVNQLKGDLTIRFENNIDRLQDILTRLRGVKVEITYATGVLPGAGEIGQLNEVVLRLNCIGETQASLIREIEDLV